MRDVIQQQYDTMLDIAAQLDAIPDWLATADPAEVNKELRVFIEKILVKEKQINVVLKPKSVVESPCLIERD